VLSSALQARGLVALVVNLVLAVIAYRSGGLDRIGSFVGALLGTVIFLSLGGAGYALLAAFYVLGSGATRIGLARKQSRGIAQDDSGRRSARNVIANGGVATAWALVALLTPFDDAAVLAVAAALAAATGDTLASEVGQLTGGRTVLITGFSRVSPGTGGGISLSGSLAGVGGATLIAVLGGALGLFDGAAVKVVALAGLLGVFADSLLGATLERRGWLSNEGVNFSATLAASFAVLLWFLFGAG
jgi:uncharacterized protein (TIGR00297 family)